MPLLKLIKICATLSAAAVVASLVLLLTWGMNLGLEFSGGTLMELALSPEQTTESVVAALESFEPTEGLLPVEDVNVTNTANDTILVRMREIDNATHIALIEHVNATAGPVNEVQYSTIGPTVSEHLKTRSMWALGIAIIAIVLYITMVFRGIGGYLKSWDYGVASIVALVHDVIVTLGIFSVLSRFAGFQADTLFVTAILSMMGYSVNDTIVIFDRIRENLREGGNRAEFLPTVARSLRESLRRTLNTGMGALIMLLSLYFLGPENLRWFILALIIGTLIGTYSSFFVATPWLILQERRRHANKKRR